VTRREKWAKQYGQGVSCPRRSIAGISGNGIWEAIVFKRIDHVEIVTDQLRRIVQFYTEVLGFTVKALDRIERWVWVSPSILCTWTWAAPPSS
jgi:DNA-binding transcriptional MocR family regulator